ncbi:molybdopterin molybdotransferase MoeA [Corynebacterium breve]|uniref:Molybdopterin molybdenumtransferase n=1 Tax=Corynebacterium breve TaxID=3049799 RepID=A0ABY8VGJ5_9CORY|nr:gephyrin-like molybdotransferase Glp [Corynebacterium breve]WIM68624.1 molybdopterin molybdotransferase MoeA [Corynebacterium breve]
MSATHDVTSRSIDDHLSQVLHLARRSISQGARLRDSVGCVLATDVRAQRQLPPFDNSAMDGFLVHAADLTGAGPWTFPVAGDIPAGSSPISVPFGSAVRIMTGAPVPPGDGLIVVPVEDTNIDRGPTPLPSQVVVHYADKARDHIRRAGDATAIGDLVAQAGNRIDSGTLAAFISMGIETVDVFRAPVVAVISTGEELVETALDTTETQIADSNRPMIAALADANGAHKVLEFHAGDSEEAFRSVLDQASRRADIVITSGGISEGAFDVVRAVTSTSSAMWFGPVAQRPGAPQGAGEWNGAALLCLPGNPVAAFSSFHLYGAPLIRTAGGRPAPQSVLSRPSLSATVAPDFPRPHRPVPLVVPVRLSFEGGTAAATPFTTRGPGSHLVGALVDTQGLAIVPPGHTGDQVTVLLTHT